MRLCVCVRAFTRTAHLTKLKVKTFNLVVEFAFSSSYTQAHTHTPFRKTRSTLVYFVLYLLRGIIFIKKNSVCCFSFFFISFIFFTSNLFCRLFTPPFFYVWHVLHALEIHITYSLMCTHTCASYDFFLFAQGQIRWKCRLERLYCSYTKKML